MPHNEQPDNDLMLSIDTDPLLGNHNFRIPLITENEIKKLNKIQKKQLNEALLQTVDQKLHEFSYVPGKHLKQE